MKIKNRFSILCIIILAVSLLQSCSDSRKKNVSELMKAKGIIYDKETKKRFSGIAVAYYSQAPKRKKSETPCINGLIDGIETIWYKSGKQKARKKYLKGKLHGESVFWYTNGQKQAVKTYKQGKISGRQKSWEKDGSLIKDKIIH